MAKTRRELHEFLKSFTQNVYFQPPSSVLMKYPAIVYNRNRSQKVHANNDPYLKYNQYMITVIDRDPDSEIAKQIEDVRMCSFDRTYTADNLNHFVYTLYF